MMNSFMKTIYSGYQDIKVIGDNKSGWGPMKRVGEMSENNSPRHHQCEFPQDILWHDSADLLIIDIDSFGVSRTGYLIFLASCFTPDLPLVLITERVLSIIEKQQLMMSGRVLDVIKCSQAEKTAQVA